MPSTILIVDGVSTNRIMLKVQLSAAYYHVVQADCLDGLIGTIRRTLPDLIIASMQLPDGDAVDLRRMLIEDDTLSSIPIIALTQQNDKSARLRALEAGLDDVFSQPVDDLILQARIRSLIRAHNSSEEQSLRDSAPSALGFAEPISTFAPAATISLVTEDPSTAALWKSRLGKHTRHQIKTHQISNIQDLMAAAVSDVFVIELNGAMAGAGLRLMAELRSRGATCNAAIIAVTGPGCSALAADALDRGAHDVLQTGFCPDELALRATLQLQRKARSDRLRDTVRDGLRASVRDPMTGLYNRRFALPQLSKIAAHAEETQTSFAVMLADLDHFKQINDCYGHMAGDAVLTETARRFRTQIRSSDLLARVGGEEFMVAMPTIDRPTAMATADRLCREINSRPFVVSGIDTPIRVTTSIGVVVFTPSGRFPPPPGETPSVSELINQADRALYVAKGAGRNQVTLINAAA